MELAEAIEVVREFQAWRRGGDQPMPYPQTTGEALDALCDHAERMDADLATERALADRLADALENSVSWDYAKPAFDAWEEARRA